MEKSFAITTHVPVERATDWLLAHGYPSRVDADIDLIMALLDHKPLTFAHDGVVYEIAYVGELDAYDVSMATATSGGAAQRHYDEIWAGANGKI